MKAVAAFLLWGLLFVPSKIFAADICAEYEQHHDSNAPAAIHSEEYYLREMCENKKKALAGDVESQRWVGVYYRTEQRAHYDYAEAKKWFVMAGDKGDAFSQAELGRLYYEGKGVPRDYSLAGLWWLYAAQRGAMDAQLGLSRLYFNGQGFTKDFVEAYFWASVLVHNNKKTESYSDPAMEAAAHPERELQREIEKHLTTKQIADVKKRVNEWQPLKDKK